MRTPWHHELNHFIHFLGGAAVAFFFLRAVEIGAAQSELKLPPGTSYAIAFMAACCAALFWEIGEFTADRMLHTRIQENVIETMLDLIAGASGAAVLLFGFTMARCKK